MISIEITDVKSFMNQLLLGEKFDRFRCLGFLISGYADFSMEGDVLWKELRPLALEMIKGHETPKRMKFVYAMKQEQIPVFLNRKGIPDVQDVSSLNFTILFQEGQMVCTTGCARSTFTLDKTVEQCWDKTMEAYLA